jgi:hypothetical protein
MAGTLKKMRITVACAYGDVGHEFTPTAMVRDFLLANRYAVIAEEAEMPGRPAKFAGKAAKKIADGAKSLFGGR